VALFIYDTRSTCELSGDVFYCFQHQECIGVEASAANRGERIPRWMVSESLTDVQREKSAEQKSLQAFKTADSDESAVFLFPGFQVFQPQQNKEKTSHEHSNT